MEKPHRQQPLSICDVLHLHVASPTLSLKIQMIKRSLRSSAEFVLTSHHDCLVLKFKHRRSLAHFLNILTRTSQETDEGERLLPPD